MVRKLKHHEQKLLKKVDFLEWKQDQGHRDSQVMRMYHIQNRDDYHKYNKLCGQIRRLANNLAVLPPQDPIRIEHEKLLLEKLSVMGILPAGKKPKVSDLENKITVSAFCRRRIPVVMCRLKMAQTVTDATKYIEQGHVRVGPQLVTDPAFLVTKPMEDFVTWVDSSKIKKNILKFRNEVDDFDIL